MNELYDVEAIMTKVANLFKQHLPQYISDMNTIKGDSLLPAFVAADYHLWQLRDVPAKRVSFLQFIVNNPRVKNANNNSYLVYPLQLNCMWRITDRDDMALVKARYHYIFLRILTDEIGPVFPDLEVTDVNSILAQEEDTEDNLVEFITVTFTIGLPI